MRIGIDGRYIQDQYHGVGRYAFHVAKSLAEQFPQDEWIVFYNPAYKNSRFRLADLRDLPNVLTVGTNLRLFRPEAQVAWPRLLRQHGIDLFYTPFFDAPWMAPCPVAITIHDLIFDRYPQFMPQRRYRGYYQMLTRMSLRQAAAVLTVSNATQQDLVDLYGVNTGKIYVTPEAADGAFQPASLEQMSAVRTFYRLPNKFILTVGTQRPHKNVTTLLRAFAQIAPYTDASLVIAGKDDKRWPDEITPLVEELNITERVIRVGHVLEKDLPALYSTADVFVFPSLIEGFGLPPLEAMACGTPVVASDGSSLPEVVGHAGLLVDPLNVNEWAETLLGILSEPRLRRMLSEKGLERAASYSWRRTAHLTHRALSESLRPEFRLMPVHSS